MGEDELTALADVERGQHFLVAVDKLDLMMQAADIRPTDRVVELGAGVGTVARVVPPCRELTLIELDARLVPVLRETVPRARVLNQDGVLVLRRGEVEAEVIVSNLPWRVAPLLVELLPRLLFRTAVVTAGSRDVFEDVPAAVVPEFLTTLRGSDFLPPQSAESYVFLVRRRPAH